jgi:peptidoglycan/LPS O-acetylase OafA/YrhL
MPSHATAPAVIRHHRRELQGLRAVAAGLVLAFHARVPGLEGGFLGVDVFLVLSGYVVTRMLFELRRRNGRVDLVSFAVGRLRRLAPAAVVVVIVTCGLALATMSPLARPRIVTEAWAALFGYENVLLAVRGVDYLQDGSPSAFQQFWSLGLEVQFYLVWPVVLVVALNAGGRRAAAWTTGFAFVASALTVPVFQAVAAPMAFFTLLPRAPEFLAGALVAVVLPRATEVPGAITAALRPLGVVLIAGGTVLVDPGSPQPGLVTLLPVLGTVALVVPAAPQRSDVVGRLLATRPLAVIGSAAYSIYLWHWPVLMLPVLVRGAPLSAPVRALLVAASLVVGLASAAVLERRGRRFLERCRMPTTVGLAIVAVLGLLLPAVTTASFRTTSDERVAEPNPRTMASGLVVPEAVPVNVSPGLTEAAADLPFPYADGCVAGLVDPAPQPCHTTPGSSRRVALVGDSHATQWADVVRVATERADVGLSVYVRAACPFADVPVVNPQLGRPYRECDAWRRATFERIRTEEPEVVVVSEATSLYRGHQVEGERFGKVWQEGIRRSLSALPATTRVVFVQDTPIWAADPNECLVRHVDAVRHCGRLRRSVVDGDVRMWVDQLESSGRITVVDPVPALCRRSCSPLLWNVLVYRDASHLTATATRRLGGTVREHLLAILRT